MDIAGNCMTVRQPWAWSIFHAGKDVECRGRTTSYRGQLLIHAASQFWAQPERHWLDRWAETFGLELPDRRDLPRSVILGTVELIGVSTSSASRWALPGFASYWQLADPQPFEQPLPYTRGQLGIYRVSHRDLEQPTHTPESTNATPSFC